MVKRLKSRVFIPHVWTDRVFATEHGAEIALEKHLICIIWLEATGGWPKHESCLIPDSWC